MATRSTPGPLGDLAAKLNSEVDCEDLAERLGLRRPSGKGNFHSPHKDDKSPSVTVFAKDNRWKDFSDSGGSINSGGPVDMLMWHSSLDFVGAVKELASMYGHDLPKPGRPLERVPESLAEMIARKAREAAKADDNQVYDYLQGRGIDKKPIADALAKGTLGLNTWSSDKVDKGLPGHGGPAVAFIVKERSGKVVAVDMRYFDAEANGHVKSQCQGEKYGHPWVSDWRRVEASHTVYIVESPINALSVESCPLVSTAAVATRGTGNVENIDWTFLRGKSVVLCFDNDKPVEKGAGAGYCAGRKAAWRLHEILTGLGISCLMVDQTEWFDGEGVDKPINDINDMLKEQGMEQTTIALRKIEEWLIPGQPAEGRTLGKSRIWWPTNDFTAYRRYRVTPDFTRTLDKYIKDEKTGEGYWTYNDVCGFRVAAVSRVQIASDESAMTGAPDHSPQTMFALTVQTPADGPVLQSMVVDRAQLRNLEVWKKNGFIFAPTGFSRMVSLWERAASIGEREAVNFVGLAWRNGKPVVNEASDCFFTEPTEQCPYHGFTFPSGRAVDAVALISAFQGTFSANAAAIPLVWALGGHLKAYLGFWPHFVLQAEKGAGKSVLVKAIGRAVAMKQYSRQTLGTEYRIIGSISYTSHPVAWGEFSTNKQDVRAKAVASLQESYGYEATSRGMGLKRRYLLSAPVLLSGEDVPVDGLEGKVIRSSLTLAGQGPEIDPEKLGTFPVRQWLEFLASVGKARTREIHASAVTELAERCAAEVNDAGAKRMLQNYAGVYTAWLLMCEFAGLDPRAGSFARDLTAEMNTHISETKATRQPWVSIIERVLNEIAARNFRYPFEFSDGDETPMLFVRTAHVMAHLSQTPGLRDFYDELTIKSDRVLKQQLVAAGVVDMKGNDPRPYERTVRGQRVSYMVGLIVANLKQYGLHPSVPLDDPAHGGGSTSRTVKESA
jgi:hypothetical protein